MNYTTNISLQKPLSNEKYNVSVANTNADIIDSEINKLKIKNESQDSLLEENSKQTYDTIVESDSTIVTNADIDKIFE